MIIYCPQHKGLQACPIIHLILYVHYIYIVSIQLF